jgi:arginine deiminase
MESIFKHHPEFGVTTVNPENADKFDPKIAIEGGDVLVIKEDIFLIGTGPRTTSQGIDFILDELKKIGEKRYVIVQELPHQPESFIHLDMAFTMIDRDKCMVYEPLILMPNKYQTVMIEIDNGKVVSIRNVENILVALKSLGIDLEPLYCGGRGDQWVQEREQWHSGANFFAIGPGRVIGYERNDKTIEELNKHGFEVLPGVDVARGIISPDAYDKYVIAIDGSELSRGGGGCRCMTMPVRRQAVSW